MHANVLIQIFENYRVIKKLFTFLCLVKILLKIGYFIITISKRFYLTKYRRNMFCYFVNGIKRVVQNPADILKHSFCFKLVECYYL